MKIPIIKLKTPTIGDVIAALFIALIAGALATLPSGLLNVQSELLAAIGFSAAFCACILDAAGLTIQRYGKVAAIPYLVVAVLLVTVLVTMRPDLVCSTTCGNV